MSRDTLREALERLYNAWMNGASADPNEWRRLDREINAALEQARAALDADPEGLDDAWERAWAALPSPTWSVNVRRRSGGVWEAWAQDLASNERPPVIRIGEGPSEAAALLDVAARLSEQS